MGLIVGEGVPVWGVNVAGLVIWLFTIAAIVWYTWVWFGVAVLIGRLPAEMRFIICHSRKMLPAATANQTSAVKNPNRIGDRFFSDIRTAP